MARCLSFIVISILALVTILAIKRTSAVCCNNAEYDIFYKCDNIPHQRESSYEQFKATEFYVKNEPDWKDSKLKDEICYTQFCADGSAKLGNCGIGGFFCNLTGCACSDCFRNKGTDYDDMKIAWAKKNGFLKICSGFQEKCANIK